MSHAAFSQNLRQRPQQVLQVEGINGALEEHQLVPLCLGRHTRDVFLRWGPTTRASSTSSRSDSGPGSLTVTEPVTERMDCTIPVVYFLVFLIGLLRFGYGFFFGFCSDFRMIKSQKKVHLPL
jgi:hypothetical protein